MVAGAVTIMTHFPQMHFENLDTFLLFFWWDVKPQIIYYFLSFLQEKKLYLIKQEDAKCLIDDRLFEWENIISRVREEFTPNSTKPYISPIDGPFVEKSPIFQNQKERYEWAIRKRMEMYELIIDIENEIITSAPSLGWLTAQELSENIVIDFLKKKWKKVTEECMARMLWGVEKWVKWLQVSRVFFTKFTNGELSKIDFLKLAFSEETSEVEKLERSVLENIIIELWRHGGLIFRLPKEFRKILKDNDNLGFKKVHTLFKTIIVVYNDTEDPSAKTLEHEQEHVFNEFIFPEYNRNLGWIDWTLSKTKDEILAFYTGENISPLNFLPGWYYFEKYQLIYWYHEWVDKEMCDAMMVHDFISKKYGNRFKWLFRCVPLRLWRKELTHAWVQLPMNNPDTHTKWLWEIYPIINNANFTPWGLQSPGIFPYNINHIIRLQNNPPRNIIESIIFKYYWQEGIYLLKFIDTKKSLERTDRMIFLAQMSFLTILNQISEDLSIDESIINNSVHRIFISEYGLEIKKILWINFFWELTPKQQQSVLSEICLIIKMNQDLKPEEIFSIWKKNRTWK